jgi:preprotein translocase subunit SecY
MKTSQRGSINMIWSIVSIYVYFITTFIPTWGQEDDLESQINPRWNFSLIKKSGNPYKTLSHNVVSSRPCHEWGSNSQL